MKSQTQDASAMLHDGLRDHPEVQLVLKIAAQARFMEQHVAPVEIDLRNEQTLTPTTSQIPDRYVPTLFTSQSPASTAKSHDDI